MSIQCHKILDDILDMKSMTILTHDIAKMKWLTKIDWKICVEKG